MDFTQRPSRILFAAYRGMRTLAPENTLRAFALALEAGADFFRCDARTTADGQVVIIHDATLERTTNVRAAFPGRDTRVAAFTMDELRRLDAGSWFVEEDPFGTIAAGEVTPSDAAACRGLPVPTLDEVLAFVKETGFRVNIEMQAHESETNGPHVIEGCAEIPIGHGEEPSEEAARALGRLVAGRVAAAGLAGQVLLSSTSRTCLCAAWETAPAITLGLSVVDLRPFDPSRLCREAHAHCYLASAEVLSGCVVNCLTHYGIPVYVWTVDDVPTALRYCVQGVSGFLANDPTLLGRAFPNRPKA